MSSYIFQIVQRTCRHLYSVLQATGCYNKCVKRSNFCGNCQNIENAQSALLYSLSPINATENTCILYNAIQDILPSF